VSSVKLLLTGDVMTGRGVDQILPHPSHPRIYEPYVQSAVEYVEMAERRNGPVPRPVSFDYIWGDALAAWARHAPDVRIINLETAITTSDQPWPKGINYRMHPANAPCLKAAGVHVCALANNHVMDWGVLGLSETLQCLEKARIQTAGAGMNQAQAEGPALVKTAGTRRVLVFALGTSDSGIPREWAAGPQRPGVAMLPSFGAAEVERLGARVRAVKRSGDIAVLSIHWGSNWGYHIPEEHRTFAHAVLERAGIDLVHGHSSHHPRPMEVYQGRLVLYGCGDLINDYEGIGGYEEFRSHVVASYIAALEEDGRLNALELQIFETRRLRLERASQQNTVWLAGRLNQSMRDFGSRLVVRGPALLQLQWAAL
jgi:poly-gamma-glutamate synthesis protein (capsule biosynthesis protein)